MGFRQSAGAWLYTRRVERRTELHEAERCLSLLEPLGIPLEELSRKPVLAVTGEESNHVFGRLGVPPPLGEGPLVVLAPGSVWGTKMWLAERFAELIDRLAQRWSARIILAGSPMDRLQADRVMAAVRAPVTDVVGRTDLRSCAR